jgi:Inner membrane protein YgaP-like, transmembrane domain
MKKNLGSIDRAVRTILALALAYLIFNGSIAGTLAVILGVVAVLLLVTSAVSFCPVYLPFKISTLKKNP